MIVGELIGGRYEVLERIDEGGMSYVYKCYCRRTKRIVALKVLKEKFAADEKYVEAFKHEAISIFKLHNKHVVDIYSIGASGDIRYIVMEYVPGPTLKEHIAAEGKLAPESCIKIASRLLGALHHSHRRGIVHKDLKPSNVLMRGPEDPVLIDFGIAGEISAGSPAPEEVLGSVLYFAPEQAKGEAVDGRTDIYSLGVMLYEMLTGRRLFEAEDSTSVALMHLHQPPVPPDEVMPGVPRSLSRVVLKALEKEPSDRYESAAAMIRDLGRALKEPEGEYVRLKGEDVPEEAARRQKRHGWKIAGCLAGAVALFAILAVWLLGGIGREERSQQVFMPVLVDKTLEEAQKMAQDMELQLTILYEPSMSGASGMVTRQSPEAGAALARNEHIEITVSKASDMLFMPELGGMTQAAAVAALSELGLGVPEFREVRSAAPAGQVVEQSPAPGSPVNASSPLCLFVSIAEGKDVEEAPELLGKNLENAAAEALEAGYMRVLAEQSVEGLDPGTVIGQSPGPGESGEDTMRLTVELLGVKNYFGRLRLDEERLGQGGSVMVTAKQAGSSAACEFIVFEETFENALDIMDKYGTETGFGMYINATAPTVNVELVTYLNGQIVDTYEAVLEAQEP